MATREVVMAAITEVGTDSTEVHLSKALAATTREGTNQRKLITNF